MLKNTKFIKPVMIACSAGLLFTACATDRETSYSSTSTSEGYSGGTTADINESSGSEWQQGSTRSQHSSNTQYSGGQSSSQDSQQVSGNEVIIPLHEERLNVGKRTVDAGTVTIRKVVTSETVNQPIELRRETLVIDRESSGAQSGNTQFQSSTSTRQRQASSANINSQGNAEQSGAGISADAQVGQAEGGVSVGAKESGAGISAQADFDQDEPAGAATSSTTTTQRSSTQFESSPSSQNQNFSSGGQASGNAFQEQTYTIQLREEQPVVEKSVVQTGQVVARKNSQMQRQTVQREVRREDVRVDQGANAKNVQIRGDIQGAKGFNEPSGAESRGARFQHDADAQKTQSYKSETEITTESDVNRAAEDDQFEDSKTLDDINQGSNTRGGAEDLQRFDERSTPRY